MVEQFVVVELVLKCPTGKMEVVVIGDHLQGQGGVHFIQMTDVMNAVTGDIMQGIVINIEEAVAGMFCLFNTTL